MKTIQSLLEPQKQAAPMSREEEHAARALKLAKVFLMSLLKTEYFNGPCHEGQSPRRLRILKDDFLYFCDGSKVMKGVVGRMVLPHVTDFLERSNQYEINNNKKMSLFVLREAIDAYQGANQ